MALPATAVSAGAPQIAPEIAKPGSIRCCPKCGERRYLSAGRIVYPNDRKWCDRFCLICWPCWMVYRRGDGWLPINRQKHVRQWRIERQLWGEG